MDQLQSQKDSRFPNKIHINTIIEIPRPRIAHNNGPRVHLPAVTRTNAEQGNQPLVRTLSFSQRPIIRTPVAAVAPQNPKYPMMLPRNGTVRAAGHTEQPPAAAPQPIYDPRILPLKAMQSPTHRKMFFPVATPLSANWKDRGNAAPVPQSAPTVAEVASLDKLANAIEIPRDSPVGVEVEILKQQQRNDVEDEEVEEAEGEEEEEEILEEDDDDDEEEDTSTVISTTTSPSKAAEEEQVEIVYEANATSLVADALSTPSTTTPTGSTVDDDDNDEEEYPEEFILEDGGDDEEPEDAVVNNATDVSYDMISESVPEDDDEEEAPAAATAEEEEVVDEQVEVDGEKVAEEPQDSVLSTIYNQSQEAQPQSQLHPLEWHIQQTMVRLGSAGAISPVAAEEAHSGVIELQINKGRILSQSSGSGADNLITVMHPITPSPDISYELNHLNRMSPDSWRPSPRNKRLRSEDVIGKRKQSSPSGEEEQGEEDQQGGKRKYKSISFELDLDKAGQFTRVRAPNLKCDESIIGQSSDDLSDAEPNDVSAEVVLMPGAVTANGTDKENDPPETDDDFTMDVSIEPILVPEVKEEPVAMGELPVMLEGRELFNSEENNLEATKAKVRECFRPSEMGGPDPNGFDFLHWQSKVGVLFGSNLSFFVNELGIVDVKVPKQWQATSTKPVNPKSQSFPLPPSSPPPEQPVSPTADKKSLMRPKQEVRDTFWSDYMESRGSYAAPRYLFRHIQEDDHPLSLAMMVEVIDPDHLGQITLGTVNELLGGRVAVKLVKSNQVYYFNRNSWRLFPVGCGAAIGMPRDDTVTGRKRELYENPALVQKIRRWKSQFREKAQLEAFDCGSGGGGSLRPASVYKVIRNRLLIVFDEDMTPYQDSLPPTSFWCTDDSPLIRPANYHVTSELSLLWPRPTFKWPAYMQERGTVAVPQAAFRTRKSLPFREGMQLEVVDRINPQVMRPATVKSVFEYEIQILYDGFPEDQSQNFRLFTWDDSEDLFPIGWCLRNLHVMVVSHNSSTHCSRGFCGDVGNRNAWRMFHATVDGCPYKMPEFMNNFQRDPVLAGRFTRYPKLRSNRNAEKPTVKDERIAVLEDKVRKMAEKLSNMNSVKGYGPTRRDYSDLWRKHVVILQNPKTHKSVLKWTCPDVEKYINALPQCQFLGSVFLHHDIDGEALLSLTERDLLDAMSLKLGVVSKIYNAILKLRVRVSEEVYRGLLNSN